MMKQMVFFPNMVLPGRHSSKYFFNYSAIQGRKQKRVLKRLIRKAARENDVRSILSVHGEGTFETCLADSAPKGAKITRIHRGLRDFRSKPQCDLLFYACPQTIVDLAGFLEDLCYCRMLLRPGAFLFLVAEGNKALRLYDYFCISRREEASWLRRAGFMQITAQKMNDGAVLFGGQRPLENF